MDSGSVRGKTCVVLGGGGFLGHQLCRHLLAADADVRAFGRNMEALGGLTGVTRIPGDFGDTSSLAAAIDGADIIYHLIGTTTPATAEQDRGFDLTSNVLPTLSLLELCQRRRVPRVVFASSGGTVYGPPRHTLSDGSATPFAEDAAPNPICSYGITKLAIERYLRLFNRLHRMKNVILRISNPFGPFQYGGKNQGVIGTFMRAILKDEEVQIWGNGEAARDFIFVDDVARAFILAGSHEGADDLFNIGTGISRSLNDLILDIERLAGMSLRRRYLPPREIDVPANVLDIRAAADRLKWHPQAHWDQSLRTTLDWVRTEVGGGTHPPRVETPSLHPA